MSRRIRPLTAGIAAFGLALALILVFALPNRVESDTPADPSTLARVAEKNDDAATRAAARMREESARATAAAEAQTGAQTASADRP